jgi:hypothetical protein
MYILLLLDLTLAVPVANSLTFVATALCGWSVGEETPNRSEWKVVLLEVCNLPSLFILSTVKCLTLFLCWFLKV